MANSSTDLSKLDESQVLPGEIDSLGHMNVRYYVSRIARANQKLLERVGMRTDKPSGQILRRVDTYSRFHREQFAGATLHTYGGLIAGEGMEPAEGIRAYFEIRNPANEELAASFIVTTCLIDAVTQTASELPSLTHRAASAHLVQVPPYGAPRSLSLAAPRSVALQQLEQAVSSEPAPDMMSGRREGTVQVTDCDERGWLREDVDLMFAVHHPPAGQHESASFGPPLLRDAQGRRYSWAMMETRSLLRQRPRAGDVVVSIGTNIAHGEKWRHSRRWMFVKDTGLLLGVSDNLGLCIDLDERRAIPIPSDVRAAIQRTLLPQFA